MAPYAERLAMVSYVWDPDASSATSYAWFVWICPSMPALPEGPRFPVILIPPGCKGRLTRPSDFRLAKREAQLLIGGQP